ncbi:33 kDa chaperonin [Galdieria sulphuraria]|nr:33 kDa chaperonin [Galdieria sulphuraria]
MLCEVNKETSVRHTHENNNKHEEIGTCKSRKSFMIGFTQPLRPVSNNNNNNNRYSYSCFATTSTCSSFISYRNVSLRTQFRVPVFPFVVLCSANSFYDFMVEPVPGDELARTISCNGKVSLKSLVATGLVDGAARIQETKPVATAALGRTLICALLLSAGKKSDETVNIEFRGSGPLRTVVAVADGLGQVRGYVGDRNVDLPPNRKGKLDVSRAIGEGIVRVTRNHYTWKQPYQGLTRIVSGEVAEDIANYLYQSEQIFSAVAAGVFVKPDGSVSAAGGYLVQLLPGASEETLKLLEETLYSLEYSPTEMIRLVHKSRPLYRCHCSIDRVERTVALLPKDEIDQLVASIGTLQVKCEFCNRTYQLTPPEIEQIYQDRK